jgi:glycosyltransferase involved in cell wall biosynthesis
VAVTYSGQFYDVARDLDARAIVIASNVERRKLRDGNFRIEHRPFPAWARGGALYHLTRIGYALRLVMTSLFNGVDVAVVSTCDHWWLLRPLRWMGVKVVPSLHCVLRSRARKDPVSWLERRNIKFLSESEVVMAVSHDIAEQLRSLAGDDRVHVRVFTPWYRAQSFEGVPTPPEPRKPFRVFYAGRIERKKGVFDLLAIAKRFADAGRAEIEFDLCGDGAALAQLREDAVAAGLAASFRCHGHLEKPQMREMYGQSHVVIVPTTTEFVEGFNKVVAEAVLAGRPVVTSSVCPALSYVRDAVVEVPPDDVQAYGDAILSLCDDADLYNAKRRGCEMARAQFYDGSRSWAATLKNALAAIGLIESPVTAAASAQVVTIEPPRMIAPTTLNSGPTPKGMMP